MQAHLPQLRPPPCDMMAVAAGQACEEAGGVKACIFFAALYLVALGSGCLKPNIIAHGADQFQRGGSSDARRLSSYFNAAYFSFCVGELVALTVLVWVQTRSGMGVGFGVSAAAMGIGLLSLVAGAAFYRNKRPQGSIFTPITKVCIVGAEKVVGLYVRIIDVVRKKKTFIQNKLKIDFYLCCLDNFYVNINKKIIVPMTPVKKWIEHI